MADMQLCKPDPLPLLQVERTGRQRRANIELCAGPPFTKTLDHAGHTMKLEPGVPAYLDRLFVRVFAIFGGLLLVSGLVLFVYQTYIYIELGIWSKLPASSFFIEPRIPADVLLELQDSLTGASAKEKDDYIELGRLPASSRKFLAYKKLYSVVPDWFRSKTSWLANPGRLYGLHNIVIWLLDFLSISVFLFLVGWTILALSLRDSSIDAVPVSREHTT